MNLNKTDTYIAAWFSISLLFWALFSVASHQTNPILPYAVIWGGIVGSVILWKRARLREAFARWKISRTAKFILLGYAAVLVEEIIAAFSNNLIEGFSFGLFLIRIGQFWMFNLFAMSGLIIGLALVARRYRYSRRELFYIAGIWGIFAEGIAVLAFSAPIVFLLMAALEIVSYGFIIAPAALSMVPASRRRLSLGRERSRRWRATPSHSQPSF